jgi:hypothetical protein
MKRRANRQPGILAGVTSGALDVVANSVCEFFDN